MYELQFTGCHREGDEPVAVLQCPCEQEHKIWGRSGGSEAGTSGCSLTISCCSQQTHVLRFSALLTEKVPKLKLALI